MTMKLQFIDGEFCVCKLEDASRLNLTATPCFLALTEAETSFVCPARALPPNATHVEDGWRCFYIRDSMDFSLVGVMAGISGALAGAGIPLLALSTFDTDYILVRRENEAGVRRTLEEAGYEFV